MNYGEVLSKAWQIIWKHKVLWLFGILASCSNANGGSGNFNYSLRRGELPPQMQSYLDQIERIPEGQIALIASIALVVILVLVVLAVFLSTIGRIGVIRGAQEADKGEARLMFGQLFRESLPYFWRVFLLNLLIGLAIAVIAFIFAVLAIIGAVLTLGIALVCLIPLICLFVPLFWLVSVVIEQANIAIVVENLGVMDGLRRGWTVFKDNLGTMIVMGLILYLGVGLIGGLIIALPVLLIIVPAVSGAIIGTERAIGGGLLIAGLCFVAYLPVLLVLNGMLTSYIESAWTLTFMRLTSAPKALEPLAEPVSG